LICTGWFQEYNDPIAFLGEKLVFLGFVKAVQGGLRHIMFVQQELDEIAFDAIEVDPNFNR
jgi:hypothetical protein